MLGVDETAVFAATGTHHTGFVTGIVDLTCGRPPRLLDVAPGRSGTALSTWLGDQTRNWRNTVTVAAFDPF